MSLQSIGLVSIMDPLLFARNAGRDLNIWKSIIGYKIKHLKHGSGIVRNAIKAGSTIAIYVDFENLTKSEFGKGLTIYDFLHGLISELYKPPRLITPREKLESFIKKRDIQFLTHFTNLENLDNIFRWGLLSRNELVKRGITFFYNDAERLDGQLDTICCSISFPNYKNFYFTRYNNPIKMCVLVIDAEVLLTTHFKSSWFNAAKGCGRYIQEGVDSFVNLFSEKQGYPDRKTLGIPDHYPTNPQAEVLIFHEVKLSYLKKVVFESEEDAYPFQGRLDGVEFICNKTSEFFRPRIDYKNWCICQ